MLKTFGLWGTTLYLELTRLLKRELRPRIFLLTNMVLIFLLYMIRWLTNLIGDMLFGLRDITSSSKQKVPALFKLIGLFFPNVEVGFNRQEIEDTLSAIYDGRETPEIDFKYRAELPVAEILRIMGLRDSL